MKQSKQSQRQVRETSIYPAYIAGIVETTKNFKQWLYNKPNKE